MAAFLGFLSLTFLAALPGARWSRNRRSKLWYRSLRKSSLNPPDRVFGIVWPALYALSAYSASRMWRHRHTRAGKAALALWGAQLAFNSAWTPLFFGARRPRAALADLGLTAAAVAGYAARSATLDRPAALAVVPYLGWLGFAAPLNAAVIRKNPRLLARG